MMEIRLPAPSRVFPAAFGRARRWLSLLAVLGGLSGYGDALAQEVATNVRGNSLRDAFFGDLHLHTNYSFDAYLTGARVDPEEAYRFARGEIVNYRGQPAQRRQALDFLAVTDHAESLGVFNQLEEPTSVVSHSEPGKILRELIAGGLSKGTQAVVERWRKFQLAYWIRGDRNLLPEALKAESASAWQREIDMANRNYRPGSFTTFIAYEWTASPDGDNLHRNIIFKGNTAPYPFSSLDSKKPEDLWIWLESIRAQGDDALAIPHNGNMSNGLMYAWTDSNSFPIDGAYAEHRQLNEPLSEIGQVKGASETHPLLSPNDEFAGYQIIDRVLLRLQDQSRPPGSYLRDALGRGLVLQRQLAVNPFKYGFAGGSDLHGGLTVSAQADFSGGDDGVNIGAGSPTADKAALTLAPQQPDRPWTYDLRASSGNLTGVWAESNTRESLYAGLRRRETFATSGTRIKVRFFGGWHFDRQLPRQKDWVSTAYATGVPMGADLPMRPAGGAAPQFVVSALKDPDGANLDRVQVIKVWEQDGQQQERVYDVAWSGRRARQPGTGKLPAVGDTVNPRTGAYVNSIGATALEAVWSDPAFQPGSYATYYVRVLEIPTPRWSTLLAIRHHLPLPRDVPVSEQQRAWTSPIWYSPALPASAPLGVTHVDGPHAKVADERRGK